MIHRDGETTFMAGPAHRKLVRFLTLVVLTAFVTNWLWEMAQYRSIKQKD